MNNLASSTNPTKAVIVDGAPLRAEELSLMHAYWQACNYLAVGMIYDGTQPVDLRREGRADLIGSLLAEICLKEHLHGQLARLAPRARGQRAARQ